MRIRDLERADSVEVYASAGAKVGLQSMIIREQNIFNHSIVSWRRADLRRRAHKVRARKLRCSRDSLSLRREQVKNDEANSEQTAKVEHAPARCIDQRLG
jgi:hypothetical protein